MTTRPELVSGWQQRELVHTQLALRAADDVDGDQAEVEGIGVPYEQETELYPGVFESFARGAIDLDLSDGALLLYRHGEPIGKVSQQTNADDGWRIRASISDTATGRDARTLAKDDVLRSLSIGFRPIEWSERVDDDGTLHITHTRAEAREVSLVPFPAYQGADLVSVRSQQHHPHTPQDHTERTTTVPETTTQLPDGLQELLEQQRAQFTELQRRVELLGASPSEQRTAHPLLRFRSMGEFIKAVVDGDDQAREAYQVALETRAYTGGTTGDVDVPKNTWVGDVIELTQEPQKVTNSFLHTYDLPGEGMGVDYGILGQNTLQVGQQAAEGDDLPFGKVTIGHATAGVGTFGGWTQLTLQEIQRMPINMLDLAWQGLAGAYGQRIEALGRGVFTAAHTNALAGTANKVTAPAAFAGMTSTQWLSLILTLAETFDARPGRNLHGIKVSRAVFEAMAAVESTNRMLVVKGAPTTQPGAAGTLAVDVPEADLYGVSIELVPNWSGSNIAAYDRRAIRTQESPGAPFRLQDSNVINLSNAFSVYGYAASYQQLADGIVAVAPGV